MMALVVGWRIKVALVMIIALAGLALGTVAAIRNDAAQDAIAKIERANRSNGDAADNAENDVMACPPGQWNRSTRKCVMP
jgi:hypothetical protein